MVRNPPIYNERGGLLFKEIINFKKHEKMEVFSILATILSAVIGSIGAVATNKENQLFATEQLKEQHEFSHNEAELANERALSNYYETASPEARRKQLEDAGLSVGLMYGGSGSGGGVTYTSQATTPNAGLATIQNPVAGGLNNVFENLLKIAEKSNTEADTEKKKEETNKLKSDIELNNTRIEQICTEMNLTNILAANAELDGIAKQIENSILEATQEQRIELIVQELHNLKKTGEKIEQEIKGLEIENEKKEELLSCTIKKIKAETVLLWKESIKTEAETQLTEEKKVLVMEETKLTFTERQKKYKEIENLQKTINKIDAEIKLIEERTDLTELEKITEVIGWFESLKNILKGNNNNKNRGAKAARVAAMAM